MHLTYSQDLGVILMQSSHSVQAQGQTRGTGAWGRPGPLPSVTKTTQAQVYGKPLFNTGIEGRSGCQVVPSKSPRVLGLLAARMSSQWDPGPAQDCTGDL